MEKERLIREILELQREADRARGEHKLEVWMGLAMTIGQLKSLVYISDRGGASPGKLAKALGVTPTNITGIVDRLVRQGLVTRSQNPEDRRMLLVRATEAGEKLVADLRQRRRGHMWQALQLLSIAELAALAQALLPLVRAYELCQ